MKPFDTKLNPRRVRVTPLATDDSMGANGTFILPVNARTRLYIISSDGTLTPGIEWEHVSVHVKYRNQKGIVRMRIPTWEEMCYVKDLFWDPEETVVQFHPPRSEWVSYHDFVLHLWRHKSIELPRPPSSLVGPKFASRS